MVSTRHDEQKCKSTDTMRVTTGWILQTETIIRNRLTQYEYLR